MKLSDLIEEGSKDVRQCFGQFFLHDPRDGTISCCVLGAAVIGYCKLTKKSWSIRSLLRVQRVYGTKGLRAYIQHHMQVDPHIMSCLFHLNDSYGISFQQAIHRLRRMGL